VSSVTTAVILAAGMGTRLKARGTEAPKGFLTMGSLPIIRESLDRLRAAGIEEIFIVTGHLSQFYDELADSSEGRIQTIKNEQYAESGSMFSLAKLRYTLNTSFLLLESDLIYESRALKTLLEDPRPDVMLASGFTGSRDEVWTWADKKGNLTGLSKNRNDKAEPPAGELVGISKISPDFFAVMLEEADKAFQTSLKIEYETCMAAAANRVPMAVKVVPDLLWAEIDDESHLERARTSVYPKIQKVN
jgi:2-aminoethylphosphonate-pyruvate transaminase